MLSLKKKKKNINILHINNLRYVDKFKRIYDCLKKSFFKKVLNENLIILKILKTN